MYARLIGTLLMLSLGAAGYTQEPASRWVTGSVGGTSDFVFRGISLTRGRPALQASLDVEFPGTFYLGGFAASTDPRPGPDPALELDVWAGKYWRLGDSHSLDLRVSQYTYPDDPRRINYNRSELTATWGFADRFFAAAIYSPNTKAVGTAPGYGGEGAWAVELSGQQALSSRWTLSAGAGLYGLEAVYEDNLLYWNATLIAELRSFELQIAWLGIEKDARNHFRADSVGQRWAVTALWRFADAP